MTTTIPKLGQLSRAAQPAAVPRPKSRWKTRIALPAVIVLATLALLAYSARGLITPAVEVWVVPVVAATETPADEHSAETVQTSSDFPSSPANVQAPGWIEPAPSPVIVPALIEGVVKDVLVLEGDRVEAGQVLVRLVDDDAKLELARNEAALREQRAMVDRASAAAEAAAAREAEIRTELERKAPLVDAGAVSAGPIASLRARLEAARLETASVRADVAVAEAGAARMEIQVREAQLHLERTQVRTSHAGVVLSLLVLPGQRLSTSSQDGAADGGDMHGGVARLYEPSKLQVRVDVPLADAAKVSVGNAAEITTEAFPGRTFRGTVTRVMHEANIQRNTVQAKVSIENPPVSPSPTLKPEMLARVRLAANASTHPQSSRSAQADVSGAHLLLLASALLDSHDGRASVWLVDHSRGVETRAVRRDITIGGQTGGGYVRVTSGLSLGDRVIVDAPPTLDSGSRVRVLGERADQLN